MFFSGDETANVYTYKEFSLSQVITYDRLPRVPTSGMSPTDPFTFHEHIYGMHLTVPALSDPDGETLYYRYVLCSQTSWSACGNTPYAVWFDSGWTTTNDYYQWVGLGFPASYYNQQLYWGVQVSNSPSGAGFVQSSQWLNRWKLVNQGLASQPQAQSPLDGFEWLPDDPPTLTFTTPQDLDGDYVSYRVVIRDQLSGGAVWTSPWGAQLPPSSTSSSVTLPGNLPLTPNDKYTWNAEYQDSVTAFHYYYYQGQAQGVSTARSTGFDDRLGASGPSPTQSVGPFAVNLATGNLSTVVATPQVSTLGGPMGAAFAYNSRSRDSGLRGVLTNDANNNGIAESGEQTTSSLDRSLKFQWSTPAVLPGVNSLIGQWEGYITSNTTGTHYFAASAGADDIIDVKIDGTTAVLQVSTGTTKAEIRARRPEVAVTDGYQHVLQLTLERVLRFGWNHVDGRPAAQDFDHIPQPIRGGCGRPVRVDWRVVRRDSDDLAVAIGPRPATRLDVHPRRRGGTGLHQRPSGCRPCDRHPGRWCDGGVRSQRYGLHVTPRSGR